MDRREGRVAFAFSWESLARFRLALLARVKNVHQRPHQLELRAGSTSVIAQ
jgi:hypothetical protein